MKRLAEIFGHDFKNGNFELFDKDGNEIYFEDLDEHCEKYKYDKDGNEICFEDISGFWSKREYDKNGNEIYYINSDGFWSKREYDKNGKEIYHEDSKGILFDNRPKTCINKEIVIDGKKYELVEK